jgi:DNA-binding MarR family transcriptional regulator
MAGAWHGAWLDTRLTHLAVRLWAVLSLECDPGRSQCRIKTRLAAKALRTTRENIDAALEQLETAGYIEVDRDSVLLKITLTPEQWGESRKTAEVPSLC